MQVSNAEQCLFIGKREITKLNDDGNVNRYFFVNIADETGEVITLFADKDVYGKCDILGLATPVNIDISLNSRQRGVSASLIDIVPA